MPRGQSDLQNSSLRLSLHDSRLYEVDGFKTTHFTFSLSHKPSLTAQACDLSFLWSLKGDLGSLVSEVYSWCDESLGGFQNKNPYDKSCTLRRLLSADCGMGVNLLLDVVMHTISAACRINAATQEGKEVHILPEESINPERQGLFVKWT